MDAPKFRPESRIRIREDGDCRTLIARGRVRTGTIRYPDGPQLSPLEMGDVGDLPKVNFYTVQMDDGTEESIPENCLAPL